MASHCFYFFFLTEYCCSVFKSCLTLCDPMDCGMPGFPVLHYLLEFAEIHVHWLVKLSNHLILCPPLLLLPSKYMNWIHFGDISMALHLDLPYSSSLLPRILNVWLKKKKKKFYLAVLLLMDIMVTGNFAFTNKAAITLLGHDSPRWCAPCRHLEESSENAAQSLPLWYVSALLTLPQLVLRNLGVLGAVTLHRHTHRELGLQQGPQLHYAVSKPFAVLSRSVVSNSLRSHGL